MACCTGAPGLRVTVVLPAPACDLIADGNNAAIEVPISGRVAMTKDTATQRGL